MPMTTVEGKGSNKGCFAQFAGPFVMVKSGGKLKRFADVGANERYRIWAPEAGEQTNASLFQDSIESRSAQGNVDGSICDGDPDSFAVTFNGQPQESAWFAVNLSSPVRVSKLVFVQGGLFHDGGWFDTSKREPEFQVQIEKGGKWIKVAPLVGYPRTTASDRGSLKAGQSFTVTLLKGLRIYGLRVEGVPASGDNPKQAFASCAELQAFP